MDKTSKKAVIVLHEIYGVNKFIKSICHTFMKAGFDVFCPDMIGRAPFPYAESEVAYGYFVKYVGFDIYEKINERIYQLKEKYEKVFIVGFSVGATIAWRCCENSSCDGIVACYGSRIRDYTELSPACPAFLLFAREDSFDVDSVVRQLQGKLHLEVLVFTARHGFMDVSSAHFNRKVSKCAEKAIFQFLSKI